MVSIILSIAHLSRGYIELLVYFFLQGVKLSDADYAKMAIAENSVISFAKDNFSKEQQDVIAVAMKEYGNLCVAWSGRQ